MGSNKNFVEVLVLYNDSDLALVKSLLETAEIPYYVENENFSQMHGAAIGMGVRVLESRFDEAKEVLASFL